MLRLIQLIMACVLPDKRRNYQVRGAIVFELRKPSDQKGDMFLYALEKQMVKNHPWKHLERGPRISVNGPTKTQIHDPHEIVNWTVQITLKSGTYCEIGLLEIIQFDKLLRRLARSMAYKGLTNVRTVTRRLTVVTEESFLSNE